jgi:hypothetical protein
LDDVLKKRRMMLLRKEENPETGETRNQGEFVLASHISLSSFVLLFLVLSFFGFFFDD